MRCRSSGCPQIPGENAPLVELGTFDEVIFAHLDDLAGMGVNCIELYRLRIPHRP